jgi:phosphatidate cytidylyltransferase
MVKRIFSTVLLWSVVLGAFWLSGEHAPVVAIAVITLLTALTLHEFYGLMAAMGARPFRGMGIFIGALMMCAPFLIAHYTDETEVSGIPVILLVASLIISCFRVLGERDTATRVESIASTVGALLYIPFMLQFLVGILMRDGSGNNLVLCLWFVAVSKFCDVGALLTGLAFGKHKMCPTISPKKTWEGAVGGVLISAGIGASIAYFFPNQLPDRLTPLLAALIALPIAITTIVSDLIESAIKRRANTKDTGALIPGIGGAFDLTDSLILTAPLAYFMFQFLD